MLSNPGSDREINLYRQVVLVSWSFLPFCICVFQRVSSTVIGPGEPALVLRSFGRPPGSLRSPKQLQTAYPSPKQFTQKMLQNHSRSCQRRNPTINKRRTTSLSCSTSPLRSVG